MKIEVEIPDEELRSVSVERVRELILSRVNYWSADATVKSLIQAKFDELIGGIVVEEMRNGDVVREKIRVELERKIRSMLTAAIKAGYKE